MVSDHGSGSWATLPHKTQLFVLALCRFAEPLSNTSVLSYVYYLLRSFDKSLPPSEIARQAGFLATSFALGQFLTGAIWGRLSDSIGRKAILLIGLSGTVVSTFAFGFGRKLWVVILARLCAGLLNGNVGVLRTMISEIVVEKKHQSRAFLIMPMCFNIGAIVGPIIGGLLAEPTEPDSALYWLVGKDSVLGGKNGVKWLGDYPFALPNVVSAIFLSFSLMMCWLFLEETLPEVVHRPDLGRTIGQGLIRTFRGIFAKPRTSSGYIPLETSPTSTNYSEEHERNSTQIRNIEHEEAESPSATQSFPLETNSAIAENQVTPVDIALDMSTSEDKTRVKKLPYREIFTSNVVLTLLSFMICPLHNGSFMQLWPLYLSTPTSSAPVKLPFQFSGGLGLSTSSVGYAMSILGFIGVTLQILVFPRVQARYGTMSCYRFSLWVFPIAYSLIPFLSVLPSPTQEYASGPIIWSAVVLLVLIQVIARTFALPSTVILLNNSAPNKQCLGTIHGTGSSLASLSRVVGPLSAAFLFGRGEEIGYIGLVWWTMALVAVGGAISSLFIYEGSGQEKAA